MVTPKVNVIKHELFIKKIKKNLSLPLKKERGSQILQPNT